MNCSPKFPCRCRHWSFLLCRWAWSCRYNHWLFLPFLWISSFICNHCLCNTRLCFFFFFRLFCVDMRLHLLLAVFAHLQGNSKALTVYTTQTLQNIFCFLLLVVPQNRRNFGLTMPFANQLYIARPDSWVAKGPKLHILMDQPWWQATTP